MKLHVARAALLFSVVLGCSACGSTHTVRPSTTTTRTTTVAKVAPVTLGSDLNFVILPPTHGAGNKTLGTFTVAGRYGYITAQCTGESPMKVAGLWTIPCNPNLGSDELGFDTAGERIHLTVRAKPGTTWWLVAGEHIPTLHIPTLVHPHRTLVLLHRTGVGNKSLGTFHLQGTVRVVTSCTGRGQFNVRFTSPSQSADPPDEGLYCPEYPDVDTTPLPAGLNGVAVSVEAGRKAHWTLTISETIVGDATSTKR